jgi:hypothetical protein
MRMRIVKRVGQEDGRQGGWGKVVGKRAGFMKMVGKGLGVSGLQKGGGLGGWLARGFGKVVCQGVGVYEDGWLGVGKRWLAKWRCL